MEFRLADGSGTGNELGDSDSESEGVIDSNDNYGEDSDSEDFDGSDSEDESDYFDGGYFCLDDETLIQINQNDPSVTDCASSLFWPQLPPL